MPSAGARVFRALVESEQLMVAEVQKVLGVRHPETARRVMEDLDRRGVMEFEESGQGKTAWLRFREEWAWCSLAESRAQLAREPVSDGGVCADQAPITDREVCVPQEPTTIERNNLSILRGCVAWCLLRGLLLTPR